VLLLRGDTKPDMASFTLGSMNFATEPSVNSPEMIKRLAETMAEAEIRPELATSAWTRLALGLRAYAGASHTVDGK
jgi:uncharacterized protein (DUF849 family)